MIRRFVVLSTILLLSSVLFAQTPAIASLKSKAAAGDVASQLALGLAYEKGAGVPQNDELAVKWYRGAAEQGNAEAQAELGVMYRVGRGVEQDKAEAAKWYGKAAAQGNAAAMYNLAVCYYNGDGLPIDDAKSYAWFYLAARAGSKDAPEALRRAETELSPAKLKGARAELEFLLGRIYAEGIGVTRDYETAVAHLKTSQTTESEEYLALMYMEGRGVQRDKKKGMSMLRKLAGTNEAYRRKVADLYWDGVSVPKDFKEGFKEYEILAHDGDPHGLYMMGVASRDGSGVAQNADRACMYFLVAANVGSPQGKAAYQTCPTDKFETSKKNARAWIKKYPNVRRAILAYRDKTKGEESTPPVSE